MGSVACIWEAYAQMIRRRSEKNAQQKQQQQKVLLDKFLGHFIHVCLEEDEGISFGDMRNLANELSQEFMRNVEAVTRNLSEEDATRALEEYMLRGRGWRLLYVILRVGVKGVSQKLDLCQVLISLLPYCAHMSPSDVPDTISDLATSSSSPSSGLQEIKDMEMEESLEYLFTEFDKSMIPLSSCFHMVSKSVKLKQLGCPSLQSRKMRKVDSEAQLTLINAGNKKNLKPKNQQGRKKMTRSTPSKKTIPESDTEPDTVDGVSVNQVHHGDNRRLKQPRFKQSMRIHHWSPLNKDEDSETDDDGLGYAKNAGESNLHLTGFHLVRIMLQLLQILGEQDVVYALQGQTLSSVILPHLLYFLAQFMNENDEDCKGGSDSKPDLIPSDTSCDKNCPHKPQTRFVVGEFVQRMDTSEGLSDVGHRVAHESDLSDEEVEVLPWTGMKRLSLLKQVVRAVLTLSSIVATQQSGVRILSNLAVFDTLLDIALLDHLITPTMLESWACDNSAISSLSLFNTQAAVFTDILCGVVHLLQAIYLNLPFNPSCINDANALASKLFAPHVMLRVKCLISYCELRSDFCTYSTPPTAGHQNQSSHSTSSSEEKDGSPGTSRNTESPKKCHAGIRTFPLDPSSDPVHCIGSLITTLKAVKVNYIHAIRCLKRRHRNCGYGPFYDHHHDILGVPYYVSKRTTHMDGTNADCEEKSDRSSQINKKLFVDTSPSHKCIVAELSSLLLDSVAEARFKSGHIHLLSTIRSVGVCCCLQPERVISALIPHLLTFSPAVRSYALDTLTSILLDQFQGSQETQGEQSFKMSKGVRTNSKRWEKTKDNRVEDNGEMTSLQEMSRCVHCYLEGSSPLLVGLPTTLDSGFSSCDIEEMRRQRLLERWKALRLLRKNIISRDESIALTCAKHLMTLAIRGNNEIKEELFFGIYLHILHMKVKVSRPLGSSDPCRQMEEEEVDLVVEKGMDESRNNEGFVSVGSVRKNNFSLNKSGKPPSLDSNQASMDSMRWNDCLTPGDTSSADEGTFDTLVPSSVMLLCVSALPYVLQVDKVMSMFLTRGGLAKLTDLLEYDQLRSPVMSVFEALVMIDEQRLKGQSDNQLLYEGGGVIQTFIDNLAKRTYNVTTTLQQISLQTNNNTNASPPSALDTNILDLWKTSDKSDKLVTDLDKGEGLSTDAQATSDLQSDTTDPVSRCCQDVIGDDSLKNPDANLVASLPVLLDMWKTCAKLCMNSRMFRAYYRDSPCLYVVQETLILALRLLGNLTDPSHCSGDKCGSGRCNGRLPIIPGSNQIEDATVVFCHQNKLEFIEAVMMVSFSCHTLSPSQKKGHEDELWLRIKIALESCIRLEHSRLSAVFQMLLNVALPRCPSVLEYSYSQIVSMLNLREKEDISDEDEVEYLLQHGYDEDGETMLSEYGYEADIECTNIFDWKKSLEDNLEKCSMYSMTTSRCFPAAFRLFVELMVACHRIASRGVILHTVALRLLQTLRSSQRAVKAVCSENLLEVLITGFEEVLTHCPANGNQTTLQEIVLSLIQVIAESQISPQELKQFLRLFHNNFETTNSLLSTWLGVVEQHPVAPNFSATFPVKTLMPIELPSHKTSHEIPSDQVVWHHVAIELDVPVITWPPYNAGFSLALWLSVEKHQCCVKGRASAGDREIGIDKSSPIKGGVKEKEDSMFQPPMQECLLVFAIGNKEKMLELWIHPRTAALVVRLTTGVQEVMVLKDAVLSNLLNPSQWHLLTISYMDVLDGSTFVGNMTVLVDGWLRRDLILDHPASMGRKGQIQRPFLCLGDARHGADKLRTGRWNMGTLRLFKGIQLSSDFWYFLYCLGPNHKGLGKCDSGEPQSQYTPGIQKHVVNATHLSWDILTGISSVSDLDVARSFQVLVYKVDEPEHYSAFRMHSSKSTSPQHDLGLIPPSESVDLLTQKVVPLTVHMRGRVKVREINTLEKAVELNGGVETFLFLVAKIFEDSMKAVDKGGSVADAEHLQSKVTTLLFKVIHRFPSLAQSFHDINGYSMLAKVFSSTKSLVSLQLLKVLMDATTTDTIFKCFSSCASTLVLRNHPECVIQDIQTLTRILLNWKVWHKAGERKTSYLFGSLAALVHPNHPYRSFNLKQMQAGDVITIIFNIYLERIQEGVPSFSVEVSKYAAEVIKGLLGSPPDLHLLMAVMDFLLKVHPDPSGFVSFALSSFYFKMWWDGMKPRSLSSIRFKQRTAPRRTISETESVGNHSNRTFNPDIPSLPVTPDQPIISSFTPEDNNDNDNDDEIDEGPKSEEEVEEEEEKNESYKYPPLKATKGNLEQSLDMDADLEGSIDMSHLSRAVGLKRSMGLKPHTPDISSSGEEKEGGGSNERDERSNEEATNEDDNDREEVYEDEEEKSMTQSDSAKTDMSNWSESDATVDEREAMDTNPQIKEPDVVVRKWSMEDESERGLLALCVSLVDYLTEILKDVPEPSLDKVFSKVISPKSMLVLANNSSSEMRLAVMKLLGAYLKKAPPLLVENFIKMDGFYLLANQLRPYPVSAKHVEVAISIFLGEEFHFDKNFTIGDLGDLSPVQQVAPILLLSLLDGTVTDVNLCKNSLAFVSQILESNMTMSSLLLELGLAETMCNLATNIQRCNPGSNGRNFAEDEATHNLLVDVQHVLCSVTVSEFSWSGLAHYQQMEDIFTLLKALEDHEFHKQSELSLKQVDTAQAFQVSLVVKILEFVEKRSEELTQMTHGWFTSSLVSSRSKPWQSSARSLFKFQSSTTANSMHAPSPIRAPVHSSLKRNNTFSSPDIVAFLSDHSTHEDRASFSQFMDSDSFGNMSMSRTSHDLSGSGIGFRFGSFFGRRKKVIYTFLTQSELLERFKKILVSGTDLAIMFHRTDVMRSTEKRTFNFLSEPKSPSLQDRYLKHLFVTLFRFYEHCLNREGTPRKNRNPILHGAKDFLRTQFTRLFLCMMSLKVDVDLRTYALSFIMTESKGLDTIKMIVSDKQVGVELSFYLYNLLSSWKDCVNSIQRELGFSLMQILRRTGYSIFSPDKILTQLQVNTLLEDKKVIDGRYRKDLVAWLQKRDIGTARISVKFDAIQKRVTEQAMLVTQDVTMVKNEQRKKLIAHIKNCMTSEIQLKKQWQEMVQNLTHERAVWYCPESYPQSWQLDPTEGPGRVRKKLQRCHLNIPKKFLLQEHQEKIDAELVDPPLIFLFEDDHQMSDSAALIYRLYTNEKILHTSRCTAVSPASESKGELLVGEVSLFFVADGAITGTNYTQLLLGNLDQLSITWPHTDIRELHKRWYQLQDNALEIFLISGRTFLLAFQSTQDRDELYTQLHSSIELPNLISVESLSAVQMAWLEGEITNYDYLMHLNKLAGRSYTDLMQYPVFPFILRDYHSLTLNLSDERIYRILKKPIAVQDVSKERRYKDNYEFMCSDDGRMDAEGEMMNVAPFHYGSHYSNSGTVLHYLVRLPPFTKMFLSYQDSSFDIPDRTFHNLSTSWRLSSYESSTDVKELIPEFYFLSDFLINGEGFNFGRRQNGDMVNDVSLPMWCDGDARMFVLIHRQALESPVVTAGLHAWIDLVFGFKQQGEEAVKAINVFHPSTYFGVDASRVKDPLKRQALLTMIRTYGQMPKQLFRSPHSVARLQVTSIGSDEGRSSYVPRPVPNIVGLRWGMYVGSLDLGAPVHADIQDKGSFVVSKMVALPTGQVFGVGKMASILLLHGKNRDMSAQSADVMWAGVVKWGYHDNIIRIRNSMDKPWINFLPDPCSGKVTCVESVPDCRLLFMAGTAGIINIYSMTHNSSKPSSLQVRSLKKTLYGHSGAINCLVVCQAFSIVVTGSADRTCIIWDLNRLTYVRSIQTHMSGITSVAVSDTLGDIASVSVIDKHHCTLQLHSVNAQPIVSRQEGDIINCLNYSSAPEGRSVNVIAGGLESGAIRLWSSWDLSPLRDLVKDSQILKSVVSIAFSANSQYLFASSSDGVVTLWDKDMKSLRSHTTCFYPVHSKHE